MSVNRPSLIIGIPAHNEEENIASLLKSITSQIQQNFILKKIIVLSDGSTDKTEDIVKKLSRKYPVVELFTDRKNVGKAYRLNQLYQIATSDLVGHFDADVLLGTQYELSKMIDIIASDPNCDVVSGNLVPIPPRFKFAEQVIYANNILWNNIRSFLPTDEHVSNLYGAASILRTSFAKTVVYPKNITSDEEFLYFSAKKNNSFRYAPGSTIYYWAGSSFKQWFYQSYRTFNERKELIGIFGEQVIYSHRIPSLSLIQGILYSLTTNPAFTFFALILNLFSRAFPTTDPLNSAGLWKTVGSTKYSITKSHINSVTKSL